MPTPDQLLQKHFANLTHVRNVFQIDPRVQAGPAQIAPWLSRVVQLVHPVFPGAFSFNQPTVRSFPAPAAGAEHIITIPPDEVWKLRAFRVELTTDATAANRRLMLSFNDTVNTFLRIPVVANHVASTAAFHSWAHTIGYEEVQDEFLSGLPDMFLDTGWRIETDTLAIQAADQLGIAVLLVEIFPT